MECLIFIVELFIIAILIFGKNYFSKKGENAALKEDSRDISYEAKKGENLATKEDIEELTQRIEKVKNEISFENQRKHEFIIQQTNRLLKILHNTEKLNEYQAILLFALYDFNSSERLIKLIEQINETLLEFIHDGRIVHTTINDNDWNSIITDLTQTAQDYANYMCYIASNSANQMKSRAAIFKVGIEKNNTELLKQVEDYKNNIVKIRTEFEENIDEKRQALYNFQIKYLAKLNIFFESDFHIKTLKI